MEKNGTLFQTTNPTDPAIGLKSVQRGLLLLLTITAALFAQTVRFIPDSTLAADFWRITPSTELFAGASFYYMNPDDSIIVWCDTSESDQLGELYIMVPGYRDSALFLFNNRQQGMRVNVTSLLGTTIPVRTEIFFMYRFVVTDSISGSVPYLDTMTRFTGQNRKGIDPKDRTLYPAANFVTTDSGLAPSKYRQCWAVAGRVCDISGTPNDTLVFGFEDGSTKIPGLPDYMMGADFDFNDVVFRVTGLRLNIELFPDSLALNVSTNAARAGDTVRCSAAVWSDSGGTRKRTPQFDSLIRWQPVDAGVNNDTLVEATNTDTAALFLGRTSGAACIVRARFVSPVTGDTISVSRTIAVRAGPPSALSIELRTDTAAATFSKNRPVEVDRIQVASNQLSRSVYAMLRDRFGNLVGFSQRTKWDTLTVAGRPGMQSGIATVAEGDRLRGEGIVGKTGGSGDIYVVAGDSGAAGNPTDTLLVNIVGASYDSLRVRITSGTDTLSINSLQISTDRCTTLYVQGRRVDNKTWEAVDVQWDFPFPWNGADVSTQQSELTFCPADTGSGMLTVFQSAFLKQPFPVTAVAGSATRLVLYRKGAPLPADTTISAGREFEISARLFDRRGIWLPEISHLSNTPLIWNVIESAPGADSLDSTGAFVGKLYFDAVYLPTKAHRAIGIVATWGPFSDTCRITVASGPAQGIVIEPDGDWRRAPNRPNPVDTVEIPDTRTSADVFAFLRDSLGNYVDSLRTGVWRSLDTTVAVTYGTPAFHGTVVKNIAIKEGLTRIVVTSADGMFTDTAWVRLLPFHYTQLRISSTAGEIDSLVCSTNDDTTLVMQGLRSDTALWRDVDGDWSISPSVTLSASPPAGVSHYSFAPMKSATGSIAAALGNNLHDTLPVRFVRGKPIWASIQLVTPAEKRIAGDTIIAVVKLYNRAGPLEGTYCYSADSSAGPAWYLDSLGDGGRKAKPWTLIDNTAFPVVTPAQLGGGGAQCFTGGEDTIGIVLYYAPASDDSLHRIRFLAGGLTAATERFRLLPGPLASLAVVHNKTASPADTLYLQAPQESAVLSAIGVDAFGNTRGEISSRWSVTGDLHAVDSAGPLPRIRYGSDGVLDDQAGSVRAVSKTDSIPGGALQVFIRGPFATVVSAASRDLTGNGLLDGIDISFSLPVELRDAGEVLRQLSVSNGIHTISVNRVETGPKGTDLRLYLDELAGTGPQTDWTPAVRLDNRSYALDGAIDTFTVTCADGAGPVIWSVTKELVSADNRSLDRVIVAFSEKIYGPDGRPLTLAQPPDDIFTVWTSSETGYSSAALLDGIEQLDELPTLDTLVFTMRNGRDLTNMHYFSVRVDSTGATGAPLIDAAGANRPVLVNQKVRVNVTGDRTGKLTVAPNPMHPTACREAPGAFHLRHNPRAKDWVRQDGAGTVLQFKIALPNENSATIAGKVTIFDFAGNRTAADPVSYVNARGLLDDNSDFFENVLLEGIIPSSWSADGFVHEFYLYWNGYTLNGHPAAPGVYRAVLTLDITTSKGKETRRFSELIGVQR